MAQPRFTLEEGHTKAALIVEERSVSSALIIPQQMKVGAATLSVDSIGGVETEADQRNRGYGRRLLEASIEHMRNGSAALSFLYGIPDFYPKFGFATVGADYSLFLTQLKQGIALPDGWSIRAFVPADLPAIRHLYAAHIARSVGPIVRPPESPIWTQLQETTQTAGMDECRLLLDPTGELVAYAWHGAGVWTTEDAERDFPDALVLSEVVANGPQAADVILQTCRMWAVEPRTGRVIKRVAIGALPGGIVAAAARHQDAEVITSSWRCGGPMARVLDTERLFREFLPELNVRWQAAGSSFRGQLCLRCETGDVTLRLAPTSVSLEPASSQADSAHTLALPQTLLARLVLGGFSPEDLFARVEMPLDTGAAIAVLCALFPQRQPYLFPADRP